MGHLDVFRVDLGWLREMAGSGRYLEWDTYGLEDTSLGGGNLDHASVSSDAQRIGRLEMMLGEGFGDRVVIGHDVCTKAQRTRYGGKGYAHILESVVPRLRARGIPESAIEDVLVHNPARAGVLAARRGCGQVGPGREGEDGMDGTVREFIFTATARPVAAVEEEGYCALEWPALGLTTCGRDRASAARRLPEALRGLADTPTPTSPTSGGR